MVDRNGILLKTYFDKIKVNLSYQKFLKNHKKTFEQGEEDDLNISKKLLVTQTSSQKKR